MDLWSGDLGDLGGGFTSGGSGGFDTPVDTPISWDTTPTFDSGGSGAPSWTGPTPNLGGGGGGGQPSGGGGGGGGFDWMKLLGAAVPLGAAGLGYLLGNKYNQPSQPNYNPQQGSYAPPQGGMPDYSGMMQAYADQMAAYQQQMQDYMNSLVGGLQGGQGTTGGTTDNTGGTGAPTPSSGLSAIQINNAIESYLARQYSMGSPVTPATANAADIATTLGLQPDEVTSALAGMKGGPGGKEWDLQGLSLGELTGDTGAGTDLAKLESYLTNQHIPAALQQRIYNDLGGTPDKLFTMLQEAGSDPQKVTQWLNTFEAGGSGNATSWPTQ